MMWRAASRVVVVVAGAWREVSARVPSGASRVRAASTFSALPGVTSGSPAGVWQWGCGSLTPIAATPHRLLHTTTLATSDSVEVVKAQEVVEAQEAELDRLYSCVEVECRGHEPAVLRSYQKFVSTAAVHLDVTLEQIEWPKKHIKRWTLLKSVHIHKKHRVQYEARTHFLVMRFVRLTGSTADTFLEYIQRNLPEGVAMKVTMHELQKLPQHVKPSSEVVV